MRKFKLSTRPRALLSRAEADAIYCTYWNTPTSAPRLAAEYGVSVATIRDLVGGRTWKTPNRTCPQQIAAGQPARPN